MIWDTHLSQEIDLLRESTHRFAAAEIAPIADEIDQKNEFPQELWQKMGEMGLLGITIPPSFGGSGMSYLAHVVAMEEISRASASVGLSYGAHSNLCVNNLYLNGNEDQRRKYLPKLCTGEFVGALAMSEPGAGSDVIGSMNCTAVRQGKGWVATWFQNVDHQRAGSRRLVGLYENCRQGKGTPFRDPLRYRKRHEGISHGAKTGQIGNARFQYLRVGV